MAATPTDAQHTDTSGVDTNDPEFWGWHHTFSKSMPVVGVIVALVLLAMTIGNHHGRVEDLWLVVIAAIMLGGIAYQTSRRRKAWRK